MAKISLSYPESGLTVNLSVLNQTTEAEDFSGVANEIGTSGTYIFSFTEASNTDYSYIATVTGYNNMSGSIFRDVAGGGSGGGLTTEEHDKLMNMIGGGFGANSIDAIDKKYIKDTYERVQLLDNDFYETNSHIDIAEGKINDKIEEIEIPENTFEEKEAKKLAKTVEKLDKKVTSYIDSKMQQEEEIGAIAREFTKQEMEDEKRRKEKEREEKKMQEEEDAKLLELIKQEFATQEEQEKEEKRKELEKELEETQKEAEEIKKELNSLK